MIVHQVAEVKAKEVLVVVDDTDIFVRVLHFGCHYNIPSSTLDGFANSQSYRD